MMAKWYEIYVEFWNEGIQEWQLSAIAWWKYLFARAYGICGSASADVRFYNYRHVPKKNILISK